MHLDGRGEVPSTGLQWLLPRRRWLQFQRLAAKGASWLGSNVQWSAVVMVVCSKWNGEAPIYRLHGRGRAAWAKLDGDVVTGHAGLG